MKKYSFIAITLLLLGLTGLYFFILNYESNVEVIIEAPMDKVWEYVGNSDNAREWSIFFDSIRIISGNDGQVGAVRRCYRKDFNEDFPYWDERTLEVRPNEYRKINTFNLTNFPWYVTSKAQYFVHQRFEQLDGDRVKLSFGYELIAPKNPFRVILLSLFASEGERIIRKNLENIKEAIGPHVIKDGLTFGPFLTKKDTKSPQPYKS